MSYDLSFEKKQLWFLGALAVLSVLLLFAAGFFAGVLVGPNVAASVPAVDVSAVKLPSADSIPMPKKGFGGEAVDKAPVEGNAAAPAPGITDKVRETATSPDFQAAASKAAAKAAVRGARAAMASTDAYTLQFGVFRDAEHAKALVKDLADKGAKAQVVTLINGSGEPLMAVRTGSYATSSDAVAAAREMAKSLNTEIVVRPLNRL